MTTTDLPRPNPVDDSPAEPPLDIVTPSTVAALRETIFGEHWTLHRRVRDIVADLDDAPRSGRTYSEETRVAPELLPYAMSRLGLTASEIAADHQVRGALCDWSQVAAPRLLLILTGHFSLSTGGIIKLGNGSRYQQDCLAELETGKAIGLLVLTELGGTNGADHRTVAEWDATTDGFWLTNPTAEAWKFMPNAADGAVPKTAIVTARLLVDGADQGVLPFLLKLRNRPKLRTRILLSLLTAFAPKSRTLRKLRTSAGLAAGVDAAPLPDKSSAPMDHGLYRFTRVWVPRDALLGGDWARMTPDGRFECDLPLRRRFHRAIGVLGDGRLDLANAAAASARAALAGLVNYSQQRRPGNGELMADRDGVQLDLVSGVAKAYATSVLGRRIRDMRTAPDADDHNHALWSMIAKPLLSYTALQVLTSCEQRAGAQGALRSNLIADWIGNLKAIITAEGENRILQVKAGERPGIIEALQLPNTPPQLPWYINMLIHRERRIAAGLLRSTYDPASSALGPESAAVEMARATGERLAATALYAEAVATTDPTARRLVESAATAYALERIHAQGAWFLHHSDMPRVAEELRIHRNILLDHLPTMVAAFGIPELSGAVFSEDYIQWYRDFTGWGDSGVAHDDSAVLRRGAAA